MSLNILQNKNCEACSGKTPKLNNSAITKNLKYLNGWQTNQEKLMIFKKFTFKSFKASMNFANEIARTAEKEAHHPDLSIGYGYCLIIIHTHAIKGLSINDFILASKIDLLSI